MNAQRGAPLHKSTHQRWEVAPWGGTPWPATSKGPHKGVPTSSKHAPPFVGGTPLPCPPQQPFQQKGAPNKTLPMIRGILSPIQGHCVFRARSL